MRIRNNWSGAVVLAGTARVGNSSTAGTLSGQISGPGALWLDNNFATGSIILSNGGNNFTGGLRVERGTVRIQSSGAVPANSTLSFGSPIQSGTLTPQGTMVPNLDIGTRSISVNSATAEPGDTVAAGNATTAGASVTSSTAALGTITFNPTGNITSVPLTGSLNVIKNVAGTTMMLSQLGTTSNTWIGVTTINAGTLATIYPIDKSSGITVASIGTLDVASLPGGMVMPNSQTLNNAGAVYGNITNNGSGLITNSGVINGNLTVTGGANVTNSNTVNGNVSLNGGALTHTGTINGSGTLNGGSLLGGNASFTNGLTLSNATVTPISGAVGTFSAATLSINNSTYNVDIDDATSDRIQITGGATLTGTSTINLTLLNPPSSSPAFYDVLTAGSAFTGGGTFSISNTAIGRTVFSIDGTAPSNILRIKAVGNAASLVWNNTPPATGDGMNWDVQGQQNFLNTGTGLPDQFFQKDDVTFNDNNNGHYAVTVGTVNPGSVVVNNSLGDYTFTGGNIGANAELTKSGTSALTIDGNHSYTGNTTLNSGTLNVKQSNALGTGTLIINGGTLDNTGGGVATLSNSAMTINANVNYVGTASLSLNTATAPVTLNTNADINVGTNTLFLNGGIKNGTGNSITKSGNGTLVLSGSSTYTGTTIVNSGQLVVGGAGDGTTFSALGAPTGGDATITTGTTMNLSSTGNINLGQKLIHISGTGLPDGNGGSFGAITNRALGDYNTGGTTQQLNALQRVILEGDASIGSPGNGPDNATNLGRFDIRAAQVGGVNVAVLNLNGHNLTKIGGSFMSLVATDVNGTGNIILKGQGSTLGMETTTKMLDDGGTSKILAGNGTQVQWWNAGTAGGTNLTRRVELGDGNNGDQTGIANGGGNSTVGMPLLFKSDVTLKPTYANFNNNDLILLGNLTEDSIPRKLTKANSGSLTLSGNNSFTGGLNISPGPNSTTATSGTGVVIMGSSTALDSHNTVAFNPSSTSWNAILRLNGFNTTVNGLDNGGTSSFVENVSVNAATLTANLTTNDYTFNGLLRDGTGGGTLNFVKSGDSHRQTLAGANTYTGTTTVTGGTLEIGNGGSGSIPGTSLITSATSNGTIVFHRDTPQTIPNVLAGSVNMHHQDGTVTLSGNSTTTGTIELSGSVLAITGSTASAKTVVNGGTLAGTGNAGNLTLNNGATIQPGPASLADGSVGTLTLNNFTGNDGTFRLDLNTLAGNDRVTVTNVASFTADHTTTFTPVFATTPTTTGSITLLTAGTLQIDPNAHFNATAPSGASRLSYHVAPVGNAINLIIDSAIGELIWTGNSDHTTWDINNHQNWKLGASPAVYLEADKVTFDGTSSDRTITLDSTVQPTLVTVNSVEYTLNGGGGFGGSSGFTKAGDGTLTLNNTGNNFSGALNVTNGAVKLGASNAIPNNAALVLGDGIANTSGVLDLHGFSTTVASLASAGTGTSHAVTNSGSSTATLTVNSSGATSTIFNGSIQDGVGTTALNFTGGTLAVNGNHTFSGGATINSGTLITSSALGTGSIINNGNLVFASANSMNVGTLSGNGSLMADGGGTLQLVGADNATGPVIIGAPAATPFSNTPTSINATNANVTATGLQVRVNNAAAATITIGSGKTLTVNGAVVIGPNVNLVTTGPDAGGVSTLVKMDGGGNFVNNVTSENFLVGQLRNNNDPGADPNATLDLSGLNNFTFDAGTGGTGEMRIGYGGNITGTLSLANSSTGGNFIRGLALRVGDSNNGNNGGPGRMLLGAGTNVINVNTATIGSGKTAGSIAFQGSGGSVTIAAQNGTDPANIFIGNATSASAATADSVFSLAGHLANINAGSVIIGRVGGATTNTGNGSVSFDTGLFNAGTIQLAVHSSGSATTQGLLTLGGPVPNNTATGVMNVSNQFLLVNRTVTAGSTATGVFTMNGGTANINSDILIVDSATSGTRSTTITLAGGNLNMMGHAIATSALPVNNVNMPATGQTATLSNLGGTGINGTGLKMNGTGTLQLDGNNSYAGTTSVQSGRLVTLSDNARAPIFTGGGADITGGRLMFDYNAGGSTDPVSLVSSTLAAGFNQSPTKFATGALRTSNPADPNKGLGWADNTTVKQLSVLYTWYGDANLDGTVNALDFNALATNFGSNNGSQIWANGDYNYDGNVNSLDFGILAANFNKQMPVPAPVSGDVAVTSLGSLVPEPSSMALLLGAGLALARRTRRRR
jgi:autotransporter-associated beta strand protein